MWIINIQLLIHMHVNSTCWASLPWCQGSPKCGVCVKKTDKESARVGREDRQWWEEELNVGIALPVHLLCFLFLFMSFFQMLCLCSWWQLLRTSPPANMPNTHTHRLQGLILCTSDVLSCKHSPGNLSSPPFWLLQHTYFLTHPRTKCGIFANLFIVIVWKTSTQLIQKSAGKSWKCVLWWIWLWELNDS